MSLELALAAVLLAAIIAYVCTGGADFGGGVWELLAAGERADAQRRALRDAVAPIWEAHHVWLIVVVVVLFVCFPPAFAAIMTALHIPLVIMLVGIVLRGSAFAFRSYSAGSARVETTWTRVFVIASAATPFMLGVVAGAVAGGELPIDPATGVVRTDFVSAWLSPFPFAIGLLTLALCTYLAAVYMTTEPDDAALRADFRRRALAAGIAVGAAALVALIAAAVDAPALYDRLIRAPWSLPFHAITGAAALGALAALARRRLRLAQLLAVTQTALILLGWALAQYPYLVAPDLTFDAAAAPDHVLANVALVLGAGSVLLVPAFVYLYAVFKR